eukprot:XP_002510793.2 protein SHORTAGE IN CHIASMATA 1 [Ricinus communis]
MRTRFLNTDYYTSPNKETLEFLNLPIPNLPPWRLHNLEQHLFSFAPYQNISLNIDRLPIDTALSKFILQATPQKLDVVYRFSEKDAQATVDNKHTHEFEVLQFEEPELDAFLENVLLPEEHMQFLSQAPETDIDFEFLRSGIKMQGSDKVQDSLYSVEEVTLEYDMDKQACMLVDDDSGQEHMNFHENSFPFLEVDEITLRNLADLSMEYELLSFPEIIKSQWTQKDDLLSDGIEQLRSMQYDVLEFLSNHCLPESEPALMDIVLRMDIISMVDKEESACFSLPVSSLVFQEYEFLEVDSSQIYEVFFEMQTAGQPETCDWMFREDKNFKNFNELIVSSELVLVDEIFKTMPTPILLDHEKVKPLHTFIEKILYELKPRPLSAFDGIYLDWHLLEEDKCYSKISSCYLNVLELDLHNIEFDWEYSDKGKGVVDFVLSDYALDGPKMKEREESLNMFSEGTSSVQLMGVDSSKLMDDNCIKSGKREHFAKEYADYALEGPKLDEHEKSLDMFHEGTSNVQLMGVDSSKLSDDNCIKSGKRENAEKVTLLFKSMSQFNDLDFFLNPGKVTGGVKTESAIKAPGATATFPKEGESLSILVADKIMDDQKLEEVFTSLPTEDDHSVRTSEAADNVEACGMPMGVPSVPHTMKSEPTQGCMMSSPEIVIVVNTQNLDKEMIVARRSTYQKILAMEKEGFQVVERDLDLPVDIVTGSAICFVWYNCRNIRKKATAADEASSCLPLCIENIATNVLTLLSYTFSCCILVFEGDTNFLSTVMESSDGLYAAAASLGIDLQLFCTYSSELTDEIILSNISYATKLYKGVSPKMPESETLAESFLTKFPSINPLTAHAMLSSEGTLIEFLEWSNERRILAVHQYHVPEESIALFSALCSYGEREDPKSIMTDCSSSVSSGPDSNKDNFNVGAEIRPRKCMLNPREDIHVDDIWQPELLNHFLDDKEGPAASKGDNCWMSRETEISHELQWSGESFKDMFSQKQGSGIAQMVDSPPVRYDCQSSRGPLVLDEIKMSRSYLHHNLLDQNDGSEMTIENVDWNNTRNSYNLHEDVLGEVIDLSDSLGKDVPPTGNSTFFSTWLPETEDSTRKSKAARKLSFGRNRHPTFPTAAAINSNSELRSSENDHGHSLQQNNDYSDCDMPLKRPKEIVKDVLRQGSTRNAKALPFREEMSHFGGTPLSKAIHSANPQPGSPWTIEFLNRIREKGRLPQQSLPCDTRTPDFGYTCCMRKATKRRSPSILEFFKYKGGSNPGKIHEQKKRKQSKHLSSSSKNERTPASLLPTWTPIDKRSSQTLSFAMNDSGSQTRLVWSDGSGHRLNKKSRNQQLKDNM